MRRYQVQRSWWSREPEWVTVQRCWTEKGARKAWWKWATQIRGGLLPIHRILDRDGNVVEL